MLIIIWDFLMAEQVSFWPEVKRNMIFGNKLVYISYLTSCQMT